MSQQINLYDPSFRRQEKPFSAKAIAFSLGAIAIGLATMTAYAFVQARDAEKIVADTVRQLAVEREKLINVTGRISQQTRSKSLEAEVARLDGEVSARQSVLSTLGTGELGNTAGFSEFMAALGRQSVPGVWLTGLKIGEAGNDLEVHGRALRPDLVPTYLRALNNEPMMRGRRITDMKLVAKTASAPAGAPAAANGPRPAAGPERFVEFTLTAPLRSADSPIGGAGKGEKK